MAFFLSFGKNLSFIIQWRRLSASIVEGFQHCIYQINFLSMTHIGDCVKCSTNQLVRTILQSCMIRSSIAWLALKSIRHFQSVWRDYKVCLKAIELTIIQQSFYWLLNLGVHWIANFHRLLDFWGAHFTRVCQILFQVFNCCYGWVEEFCEFLNLLREKNYFIWFSNWTYQSFYLTTRFLIHSSWL